MCGLILAPSWYPASKIEKALNRMSYRGAENFPEIETQGGWKLGHVRLSIQKRNPNFQPFIANNRVTAFVGEFFSHGGQGEQALIGQLLQSHDYRGFHHVDGFWSLVALNTPGRPVQAFTDHLGVKPLYWWQEHGVVCSELEPMFALEPRPALDEVYLSNCLKWGYDYSGRTPWQGITQLPPGSVLNLQDPRSPDLRTYWDWSQVEGVPETLRPALSQAISNRLVSDEPVAMLLSGGLDSSIIHYTLQDWGADVATFTVENGESEFLPPGVRALPLPEVTLPEAVRIMQAPMDLGSLLPQIQLARAVKAKGFKVCLTGDGADELFGGYSRAQKYDSQHSDIFSELPYYHLPRLDRVPMHETIELRSPFLAPRVVATALRTPRPGRTMKQVLKAAYKGLVPDAILLREKVPLKSSAVINDGLAHRIQLVKEFCNATQKHNLSRV